MQSLLVLLAILTVIDSTANAELLNQAELLQLDNFNVTEMPKPQTFSFTPIPEFRAPRIVKGPTSITVKPGSTVSLNCVVDGWPKPKVSWYRAGHKLNVMPLSALMPFAPSLRQFEQPETEPKTLLKSILIGHKIKPAKGPDMTILGLQGYGITRSGNLVIIGVTERVTGTYRCEAENQVGKVFASAIVQLSYMTGFLGKNPSRMVAKHGDTVVIPCHKPEGNPTPTLQWKFDGDVVDSDEFITVNHLGHLVIEDFSQDDEGNYTCVATNGFEQVNQTTNLISVESLVLAMSVCPRLEQIPSEKFCELKCHGIDASLFLPISIVGIVLMLMSVATAVVAMMSYEWSKCRRRKVHSIAKRPTPQLATKPLVKAKLNEYSTVPTGPTQV